MRGSSRSTFRPCRSAPGVACVLTAADIPGENDASPVLHDDPVFAEDEVQYVGQSLFAVAAEIDRRRRVRPRSWRGSNTRTCRR